MSSSSEAFLDHIADFLKFISSAQSFWFLLNTSYNHGCHLAMALYTRFGFQIKADAWRKFLGGRRFVKKENLVNFTILTFSPYFWPASFSNMNIPSITAFANSVRNEEDVVVRLLRHPPLQTLGGGDTARWFPRRGGPLRADDSSHDADQRSARQGSSSSFFFEGV